MNVFVDLKQVIYALSDALDFVGIDDIAHGKRVGIMAAECGKKMGLDQSEIIFLFDLGLLHDIGVSSTSVHKNLVNQFNWEGSHIHAEVGHDLLAGFAPLANMAKQVLYHHTRWDRLLQLGIDPTIAKQANLIFLVDRVDALAAPFYADNTVLMHKNEIREKIKNHANTYFDPDLVDIFLNASEPEAFWLLLEPRSIQIYLYRILSSCHAAHISINELKQIAFIFSRIIDAKSIFTVEHSFGVSRLSSFLAKKMGVSQENCDKLEIAGLLHDLGKLRIPDEILNKPGKLDLTERETIKTHSFETYQILSNIQGFEEIAKWAAYHHEEPNGSGYPFHLTSESMPLEARILRVADIFQSLMQDRPYRKGLGIDEVMAALNKMAAQGRMDAAIVAVISQWTDEAILTAKYTPRLENSG